jgi:hypothetical protein
MDLRKNVYSLSDEELANFVSALKSLKAKGTYDDFVRRHNDAMMDATLGRRERGSRNVAHRGPAFLPWHRYFLREFELSLQAEIAGVALPYWDWAGDAATSSAAPLWNADVAAGRIYIGGDGAPPDDRVTTGPFADWVALLNVSDGSLAPRPGPPGLLRALGRDPNGSPTLPGGGIVASALAITTYDSAPWDESSDPSFRNRLEGWLSLPGDPDDGPTLHNRVHTWVGGDMLPGTSPNDPVFYLNHCNVDRIWAKWQSLPGNETAYQPARNGPRGHNLKDPLRHLQTPDATPANCLDYRGGLNYEYDTLD